MFIFILLSLYVGFAAIATGTGLAARDNWRLGRPVVSILSGLHCAVYSLALVGLTIETFGGIA